MASRMTTARTVLGVSPSAPDCFRTITDAIAAARDGDVISVQPGTYTESIVIDRDVTLSGAGGSGEVRVEVSGEPVLRMSAENAEVWGIELHHSAGEVAIDLRGGTLRLDECVVVAESEVAVVARGGTTLRARGCEVRNPGGAGLLAFDGAIAELDSCRFTSIATTAVVTRTGGNPKLTGCVVSGAKGGVLAAAGGTGSLDRCRIEDIAGSAIVVEEGSELTVAGTEMSGIDGVAVLAAD
ncbi:MAG: right-handed parallel beta-helix repeat-containing protein, partial [Kibdelosporangium sp.]